MKYKTRNSNMKYETARAPSATIRGSIKLFLSCRIAAPQPEISNLEGLLSSPVLGCRFALFEGMDFDLEPHPLPHFGAASRDGARLQTPNPKSQTPNLKTQTPNPKPQTALGLLGFYIFRASNSEKDAFRRDPASPECRHLQSMQTQRGISTPS